MCAPPGCPDAQPARPSADPLRVQQPFDGRACQRLARGLGFHLELAKHFQQHLGPDRLTEREHELSGLGQRQRTRTGRAQLTAPGQRWDGRCHNQSRVEYDPMGVEDLRAAWRAGAL